ncbi:hypothetical protein CHARACLAT_029735 [Characodon lateralis]|uniref:Uncharacterized protein n=1 Tax=Characodon lateralis TaxID=208331 RepID=A0ABU7ENG6_9TELE|nr:hypothetical protein [Characodon lateralis]
MNPNMDVPTGLKRHESPPQKDTAQQTSSNPEKRMKTFTQHKLHTQPRSKHPRLILTSTTQRVAIARQGPCAMPPQPPPTSTTEQTPLSTVLTRPPQPYTKTGQTNPAGGPRPAARTWG